MPYKPDDAGQIASQQELDLDEMSTVPFAKATISTSTGLPSLPADATKAVISVEGGVIRYRPDGATTAPTSSVGMPVLAGATVALGYGQAALAAVRLVASSGVPVVNIMYFA